MTAGDLTGYLITGAFALGLLFGFLVGAVAVGWSK